MYFLPAAGFSVLSVDFGAKPGEPPDPLSQWPDEADVERLLTVVRWAKKAWPGTRIVLFGVSKGANIALAASRQDETVAAVVTDGLFSMREIFRDYIRRWAPVLVRPNLFGEHYPAWVVHLFAWLGCWYSEKQSKRRFIDVERLLREKHPPLLMIHGSEDDYIPGTHQTLLKSLAARNAAARHWVVPQAAHNEAVTVAAAGYRNAVLQFLDKALA